ncbi:iron-containing alcohol dehydrogenase [Bacillus sp. FJAT-44742]|uniref:iron-containing alcohol dehydrogenase n=1 Tax=Bacillus sp. FJAT-44742 TaxID=2014005 RepID=UPI000C23DF16|nr:iron-containing alcohol dehydrogenase [Bacillus sp. FJAT-44742]
MKEFTFQNTTRLHFGKGMITNLGKEAKSFGDNVLLVYGGGSIKKNGIYDEVMSELKSQNIKVTELSGVEPNPRLSTVNRGVQLAKENNIDLLLAVGGGSVIDCTKAIAVGAASDVDVWDVVTKKAKPDKALPLGTVLTLAATGSEMNPNSVITNWETNEKHGWAHPLVYPAFSILDPVYTYSVPADQTAFGIIDMMSHVIETYFHVETNTPVQDQLAESLLRVCVETGPKLMAEPENYEYRETIMYCGTMALNGVLQMGARGDWGTHNLEHAVSAVHDIPHAGGLAVLFPNWLKQTIEKEVGITRMSRLAEQVFNVDKSNKSERDAALEGIDKLQEFWVNLGAPSRLKDYNIGEDSLGTIADKALINGSYGSFLTQDREVVEKILRDSL